ncbi:hypothetical protein E4Z66_02675 [Aliishimia ponticola]|uniref:Uncharacterized protein n=1 Tax=Aliishimia ponticola TaxID=2499833 RepID=A0A4S4NFV2_9RHOB|nr:hypothetical protein [Aliishimia ponticola]THH38492.1 hypothetical protein E4Z66_02675 [Aliishimia ponticola]
MNQITGNPNLEDDTAVKDADDALSRATASASDDAAAEETDAAADASENAAPPDKTGAGDRKRSPPATRQDLIELHSRMVTMFKTLNHGLGEMAMKTAERDRKELCDRIEIVEKSLDSVEAALRVELTPQIQSILRSELTASPAKKGGNIFRMVSGVVVAIALVVAGSVFSADIQPLTSSATGYLQPLVDQITPIWGHFSN